MARLLTPADTDQFVELRRFMLRESPWAFAAAPDADRGSDPAQVLAAMQSPDFAHAGAIDGDRLVSVAVLHREATPKRRHIAWIVSVYTHPDARGRGHSRAVLELLLDAARRWDGLATVQLSASDRSPAAIALYQSLGFTTWGVEPDAQRLGDQSSAEVHMRLALAPGTPRDHA